jgi:hypothetical protein
MNPRPDATLWCRNPTTAATINGIFGKRHARATRCEEYVMTSSHTSTLATTIDNDDTGHNDDTGEWMHFGADPRFDYSIDYSIKILGACAATGTVAFLGK